MLFALLKYIEEEKGKEKANGLKEIEQNISNLTMMQNLIITEIKDIHAVLHKSKI